ncbi:Cohesin domain-containing protein [Candidatus Methanophagaceae archaeon]|nr:Cohesin domain-containing protein [Methanophagales archaeon]
MSFDPSIVSVDGVTEGTLLKQGGANTYFSSGTIDNTAGTLTGVVGAITTPGQTVGSPGVFATLQMTAKPGAGTATLDLSSVIVGDKTGHSVAITVNTGSVTVG